MKILIADDHALFCSGLSANLEIISPNANVFQAGNFSQALEILNNEKEINLIIFDLDMPDMTWEDGLKEMKKKSPDSSFVIISGSEDSTSIKKALENGISGYIPKSSETKILNGALKLIMDGGTYFPPSLLEKYFQTFSDSNNNPHHEHNLTPRQFEVLGHIAEGLSNKQIAYEMSVSEATVKLHINALLRTLHATNRTQAVIISQKKGLI